MLGGSRGAEDHRSKAFDPQGIDNFAGCDRPRFNSAMPSLTRRPHPERSDCWHVYYGEVQVGTIAVQPEPVGPR
jgi:hypothetical protein